MNSLRRHLLLASLLGLLACLLLAACGGDDDEAKSVPASTLVKAAEKTADAGAARFEFTADLSAAGQSFSFSGDGVIDSATQRGEMNIDMGEIGEAAGQDPEGWKGRQVIDGLVFYMNIPAINQSLGNDKDWIKVDQEALSKMQGVDVSQFQQFNSNDPGQMLQYLRAVSGDIKEVGDEEIDGRNTTKYTATVDLKKFPSAVPPEERDRAQQSIDALLEQTGGKSEIPTEVWIDDEDLVRRQKLDFDFETQGQKVGFSFTINMKEFGVSGNFDPPPADEVADITELQPNFGGGTTP